MGRVRAEITLTNPRRPELRPIVVEALADSGSDFLCLPEQVAMQLHLEEEGSRRQVATADGKRHSCSYVGPVRIEFENRSCYTGALVFGPEVFLGAVPMEDMDILISPPLRKLIVNPANPNVAGGLAVGLVASFSAPAIED